jgi:hypothetical protein
VSDKLNVTLGPGPHLSDDQVAGFMYGVTTPLDGLYQMHWTEPEQEDSGWSLAAWLCSGLFVGCALCRSQSM